MPGPMLALPESIRFVFFDLGNVLLSFDWARARQAVAEHTRLPPEDVDRHFRARVPWQDFELGIVDTDSFFETARQALAYEGPTAAVHRAFCDIFTPLPDNLRMATEVARALPGRTGLLSNTNPAHIAFIEERYPEALAPFALRLYSYELGLRKPDPAIYQAAAEAAHTAAGNILFIDDLLENTAAADRAGWRTILCPPGQDLRRKLEALVADS